MQFIGSWAEVVRENEPVIVAISNKKMLAFLIDVLDLELRADRTWEASPDGALGIPAGVPFRFAYG